MQASLELLSDYLDYDANTGIFKWKKSAGKRSAGSIAGSLMHIGYIRICVLKQPYMAHRLAWIFHYGELPSSSIDHINGDRSDNRISNLRLANYQENAWNTTQYSNNRCGLKGVHFNSRDKRYIAQITAGGERICLGSFKDKFEAHEAYLKASSRLHGKFSFNKRNDPR
ncbi:MAG: HNH endonuclease signature motif containing protein [Pantoea sp.]|uniref:HNH endonuclease signature motif containing protein n=1 Tax=Pantoea sp. TaxID=69393 RepID=UPI0029092F14|nr:HNH endonuclease signature motif containing protein [Pantoea sp.]MDU5780720.1 HNH endonuclease signature motif containing protein [Pantoea sp.]